MEKLVSLIPDCRPEMATILVWKLLKLLRCPADKPSHVMLIARWKIRVTESETCLRIVKKSSLFLSQISVLLEHLKEQIRQNSRRNQHRESLKLIQLQISKMRAAMATSTSPLKSISLTIQLITIYLPMATKRLKPYYMMIKLSLQHRWIQRLRMMLSFNRKILAVMYEKQLSFNTKILSLIRLVVMFAAA